MKYNVTMGQFRNCFEIVSELQTIAEAAKTLGNIEFSDRINKMKTKLYANLQAVSTAVANAAYHSK